MRLRNLFVVLSVMVLASCACADVTGSDVVVVAPTGISLTTGLGNPVGPSNIDMAFDGAAWAKFIWFKDNCTDRADSTQIARKVVVQMRDFQPPRGWYFSSGPDSLQVVPVHATEVIVSR